MIEYGVKQDIPNTLSDDGVVLDPEYEAENIGTKILDPINWDEEEFINIKQLPRIVMDRSIQWVVMRIKEPKAQSSKKRKVASTQGYRRTKRRITPKEQLEYFPPSFGGDVDLGMPTQETHESQGEEVTIAGEGFSSQPSLLEESTREVPAGSLHEQAAKDK